MTEKAKKEEKRGLLIVYTGNGKGKTTAALGMCVRAVGYDWKISIIQFVKGSWKYGELKGIKKLEPNVELMTVGEGFVGIVDDTKDFKEHVKAAKEGIITAIEKIKSEKFNIVILDELNVAHKLGLVSQEDIESVLKANPPKQHLVITGRDAPDWLIEKADLVTEMKEIKHPYQQGIMAQKGVDW
ncbi:MAG: cob(I)yrinic acid a,c-diamide adenosyltransferase [candidate division Zixibacteria bacterium]|nr:cob(I)yrinic acid a,c-diamide adenosyltransferase [candidate division Zixibacteria bacterium]